MKISVITATYNRPHELKTIALPSLQNQTDQFFEWIVINDGANPQTRDIINTAKIAIPTIYLEIEHSSFGFGLCHARNLGLETATGQLITYLDDDNSFEPDFILATKQFFSSHVQIKYSMARQNRRRDLTYHGAVIRQGKYFCSPNNSNCSLVELITQQQIFDSNGFSHVKANAPRWNPQYQVFADFEFLLQCVGMYGRNAFKINPKILVNYIQSSEGIIGSSTYTQWSTELKNILNSDCYQLNLSETEQLYRLVQLYQQRSSKQASAFSAEPQI
jgi:glycosyltransferase involved in cell wall biosynthesis